MKRIALIVAILFVGTYSNAQNRSKFHHLFDATAFSSSGTWPIVYRAPAAAPPAPPVVPVTIDLCTGQLAGIATHDAKTGKVFIDFWSGFPAPGPGSGPNCISPTMRLGTFEIDLNRTLLSDTTWVLKIPFRAWTFSVGTVPFKYRFKTGDVPATVNSALGVTVSYGRTWGKSIFTHRTAIHRSLTLAPIFGLSSADIKKETVEDPANWNTSNNRVNLAVMYGISTVFARNNLGLVLSLGCENAIGSYSGDWGYQNKPWLGIGINTSLGFF